MGSDKALLRYGDQGTQLERTATLLNSVCEKVFVSQRKEQGFKCPQNAEPIFDSLEAVKGPLCGILSAMSAHPEAHWLVLACDLPHLKLSTLEKLIHEFQSNQPQLTAYRSTHDELPEPLCAIYPSGCDTALIKLTQELGKSCPRKLLIVSEAHLVKQDDPRSLDNINTAAEYAQAVKFPSNTSTIMQIKILYFAQLADLAGKTEEVREFSSNSPAELYAELKAAYHFPHEFKQLQVAINHELSAHEAELKDGDSVAFLPPMTGG